ncbi:MAG: hypothetical protein MJE77_22300 [Proteobacteria bacterium]|nr:hypothetical protein [Pseudomonadota bacterium]
MQRFAHNEAGLGAWPGLVCIALLGLSSGLESVTTRSADNAALADSVQDCLFHFIEFGNQSLRYQPSRAIEPRWQFTTTNVVDGDQPDERFLEQRILDQADQTREFIRKYDANGPGSGQPQELTRC